MTTTIDELEREFQRKKQRELDMARAVGSASASMTAIALKRLRERCENFMIVSQIPGMGTCP